KTFDTVIPKAAALNVELNDATRDSLRCIRDSLQEEIVLNRTNIKKWLADLKTFVVELDDDYKVPSEEIFENDLGTSVVQPLRCKYDELFHAVTGRRDAFEESAIKLHYYWDALNHAPQDETDKALCELFNDKKNPKDIYEALLASLENKNITSDFDQCQQEIVDLPREYVYYTPQLPSGLKLSPECLTILKEKLLILEKDFETRKKKMTTMQKDIKCLYKELSVPSEERIELTDSLDEKYLEQKAIEEYTAQLVELWDKCLVPQFERDEFFDNVHKLNSSEDVYELLSHEVARLQELYAKCAKIYRLMLERRALIEKMTEFEKKASDPRRLFQSSFRLLEEEKWRKSCWPTLVKIEDQLINACITYEESQGHDQNQPNIIKRKDSQLINKASPSRPVSPTASVNGSRRNSRIISRPASPTNSVNGSRRNSRIISRPASPTNSINGSRRNSRIISRPASPTSSINGSRRNSRILSRPASPTRSNAPSRSGSPVRTKRSSLYLPNSGVPSRAASPVRSKRNSLYSANSSALSQAASPVISKRSSLYVTNSGVSSRDQVWRKPIKN
ncbi:6415_t:CDS:10, partial [Scutellospora calospora]